jgi:hypothetical protein
VRASAKSDCFLVLRDKKKAIYVEIMQKMTVTEQFWLARIILRGAPSFISRVAQHITADLKIMVKHESILKWFAPRAMELYDQCSDINRGATLAAAPLIRELSGSASADNASLLQWRCTCRIPSSAKWRSLA